MSPEPDFRVCVVCGERQTDICMMEVKLTPESLTGHRGEFWREPTKVFQIGVPVCDNHHVFNLPVDQHVLELLVEIEEKNG
jgi:hypothetical protein